MKSFLTSLHFSHETNSKGKVVMCFCYSFCYLASCAINLLYTCYKMYWFSTKRSHSLCYWHRILYTYNFIAQSTLLSFDNGYEWNFCIHNLDIKCRRNNEMNYCYYQNNLQWNTMNSRINILMLFMFLTDLHSLIISLHCIVL